LREPNWQINASLAHFEGNNLHASLRKKGFTSTPLRQFLAHRYLRAGVFAAVSLASFVLVFSCL
jgi:hypothetical protein